VVEDSKAAEKEDAKSEETPKAEDVIISIWFYN
jgi:hypothetical protein